MPLNDWRDVLDARKAADQAAAQASKLLELADEDDRPILEGAFAIIEGFRLEIRCLGVTISHALNEAIDAGR